MPIEIKTLMQNLNSPSSDTALADFLNDGWQIVSLSHHTYEMIVEGDITDETFTRIVTLMREAQAPVQASWKDPNKVYLWRDKQRVQLMQDLPDSDLPLNAGDLGHVVKNGDVLGVLFDRYFSVSYSRKLGGEIVSILEFCQPYEEE